MLSNKHFKGFLGKLGIIACLTFATPSYASESKTLKDWNLESYIKSPTVQWYDVTNYDFGTDSHETKVEWYGNSKERIGILSITIDDEKLQYGLVHRVLTESKPLGYIDPAGTGQFVLYDTSKDMVVPQWVIDKYKKSIE